MTESPIGPSLGPLLLGFESLGDSCEFGLVQRAAGIEPLGLLRFSSAPIAPLIEALDSGFSAFRNDPRLELFTTADHEYMVRVQPYGFSYHTGRFTTDVAERVVHAQQARIVPFLVEKLLADLASAEKIFVRKGDGTANHGSIRRLCRSIQRYGPARLLAIVPETDLRPSGTIEEMGDGLLTGYIDQFAPYDDAHDFSVVWREICFNARMFLAGASKASSILLSRQPSKVRNFLKIPNLLSARGGRVRFQGEALPAEEIPEIERSRASTRHRLTTGITSYTVAACSCVSTSIAEPNTLHVASLCVWIPAGSGVNDVCIMLEGAAPPARAALAAGR